MPLVAMKALRKQTPTKSRGTKGELWVRASLEKWRPVVGYERVYEVSNLGRVRSLSREWFQKSRKGFFHKHHIKSRILRSGLTAQGYPSVVLGRGNTRLVHRLVAEAFIGPPLNGQEVRHKDGSRVNCVHGNLEYGTRAQNIADAKRHGTYQEGRRKICKIPPRCRPCIIELYSQGKHTYKSIGRLFGVSGAAILCVVRGRRAPIY